MRMHLATVNLYTTLVTQVGLWRQPKTTYQKDDPLWGERGHVPSDRAVTERPPVHDGGRPPACARRGARSRVRAQRGRGADRPDGRRIPRRHARRVRARAGEARGELAGG